jgi:hypothetical protein
MALQREGYTLINTQGGEYSPARQESHLAGRKVSLLEREDSIIMKD